MPNCTSLVIDDEPQIRRVVRHALAEDFSRVLEAETGRRGIDLAAADARPVFSRDKDIGTTPAPSLRSDVRSGPYAGSTLSHFVKGVGPLRFWLSLGFFAIGGCGTPSKDQDTQDSIPPVPSSPVSGPKDTVAGASRLQWSLATLEEVLRIKGLNPVRAGTVRQPFMGGEGILYQIGEAELQVYLYADAGAVARDTDPLDTTRVAPPTMQVTWRMPPTLIVDNNIAAILLTRDEPLRRRIKAAIEKGHGD